MEGVRMTEVEEAPYWYVWEENIVEGKKFKVFKLGKYGREQLEKAVSKDNFEAEIGRLREEIDVLLQVIGRDNLVSHFKRDILGKIEKKAKRRCQLVNDPFWFEKRDSLEELVREGKVIEVRGWVKLK